MPNFNSSASATALSFRSQVSSALVPYGKRNQDVEEITEEESSSEEVNEEENSEDEYVQVQVGNKRKSTMPFLKSIDRNNRGLGPKRGRNSTGSAFEPQASSSPKRNVRIRPSTNTAIAFSANTEVALSYETLRKTAEGRIAKLSTRRTKIGEAKTKAGIARIQAEKARLEAERADREAEEAELEIDILQHANKEDIDRLAVIIQQIKDQGGELPDIDLMQAFDYELRLRSEEMSRRRG